MIVSVLLDFSVYSLFCGFFYIKSEGKIFKGRFWVKTKRIQKKKKPYKVSLPLFSEDFLRLGDIKPKISCWVRMSHVIERKQGDTIGWGTTDNCAVN